MTQGVVLRKLAEIVGGEVVGEGEVFISGIAGIREARPGEITFCAHPRYHADLTKTKASAVIMGKGAEGISIPMIRVDDPYYAFCQIMAFFYPPSSRPTGISPHAVIGREVQCGKDLSIHPFVTIGDRVVLGDRVAVYPGCFIGDDCQIGEESLIYPNVTIRERVAIGRRVIIHSGTVIGSDGFGFVTHGGRHHKIPQVGRVVIGDDVEIGANVTIDRATLGETRIGRGTKIDNLVHIAHNVIVGEDCLLVAQVGISGSSRVGHHVVLAGQVGVVDHVTIGDQVMAGARSGIAQDVPSGQAVSGIPARPHRESLRIWASLPSLPEMRKAVKRLEERIARIEERLKKEGDR